MEITWASLWKILLMLVLVVCLYFIRDILLVVFLGIVISAALDAPLSFFERRRIPRIISLLFIIITIIAIITILFYTIIPVAAIQIKELFGNLNQIEESLGGILGVSHITQQLEFNINSLTEAIFSGNLSVVNIFPRIFENVILAIVALFVSFYLALDRNGIEKFLKAILPLRHEDYAINVFRRARFKIGKWLEAQIVLSIAIGLITFIGLKIIGVPFSLVIGIITGIFEIVPFVGPIIAGSIAVLVSLTQSFTLGIYALLLFVVIQQLESHVLTPLIMKKATGIHPVLIIFALLAGGQIAGFTGIILAVPTLVILQELVEDYALRKSRQPTL